MDYDVINSYLDCPYKGYLTLSKKERARSVEATFHDGAANAIRHYLNSKNNFINKLGLNTGFVAFERSLKETKPNKVTYDLFTRKFINNLKSLYEKIDYKVVDSKGGVKLGIGVLPDFEVKFVVDGYQLCEDVDGNRFYTFFLYFRELGNIKPEKDLKAQIMALKVNGDIRFEKEYLKNARVVYLDFYSNDYYNRPLSNINYPASYSFLEAIVMGIKLGINYPAAKEKNCAHCEYNVSCVHSVALLHRTEGRKEYLSAVKKYHDAINKKF